MKDISYGNTYDSNDNTGTGLELLTTEDRIHSNAVNRSVLNLFEDVEGNYALLQTLMRNLYGTKNGILPDIYENFSKENLSLGYFFEKASENTTPYIRIPSGAFIYSQYQNIATYLNETYGEDLLVYKGTFSFSDFDTETNTFGTSAKLADAFPFTSSSKVGNYYQYTGDEVCFDGIGTITQESIATTISYLNFNPHKQTIKNGDYVVLKSFSSTKVEIDIIDSAMGENFSSPYEDSDLLNYKAYLQDKFNSAAVINKPNTILFEEGIASILNLDTTDLSNNVEVTHKVIKKEEVEDGRVELVDTDINTKEIDNYPVIGYKMHLTIEEPRDTEDLYFPSEAQNTALYIGSSSVKKETAIKVYLGDDYSFSLTTSSSSSTLTSTELAEQICKAVNSKSDFPFSAETEKVQLSDNSTITCAKIIFTSDIYEVTDYYVCKVCVGSETETVNKDSVLSTTSSLYIKLQEHIADQYYTDVFDLANAFWASQSSDSIAVTNVYQYLNLEPTIKLPASTESGTKYYYIYYNPDMKEKAIKKFSRYLWGTSSVTETTGKSTTVEYDTEGAWKKTTVVSTTGTTVTYEYPDGGSEKSAIDKNLDLSKRFGLVAVSDWTALEKWSEFKPLILYKIGITYNSESYKYTISSSENYLDVYDRRAIETKLANLDKITSTTKAEFYNSLTYKDRADLEDGTEIANRVIESDADNYSDKYKEALCVISPQIVLRDERVTSQYDGINIDYYNGINIESCRPLTIDSDGNCSYHNINITTLNPNQCVCIYNKNDAYDTNRLGIETRTFVCSKNTGSQLVISKLGGCPTGTDTNYASLLFANYLKSTCTNYNLAKIYRENYCNHQKLVISNFNSSYTERKSMTIDNDNHTVLYGNTLLSSCASYCSHPIDSTLDTQTCARQYVCGNSLTTGDNTIYANQYTYGLSTAVETTYGCCIYGDCKHPYVSSIKKDGQYIYGCLRVYNNIKNDCGSVCVDNHCGYFKVDSRCIYLGDRTGINTKYSVIINDSDTSCRTIDICTDYYTENINKDRTTNANCLYMNTNYLYQICSGNTIKLISGNLIDLCAYKTYNLATCLKKTSTENSCEYVSTNKCIYVGNNEIRTVAGNNTNTVKGNVTNIVCGNLTQTFGTSCTYTHSNTYLGSLTECVYNTLTETVTGAVDKTYKNTYSLAVKKAVTECYGSTYCKYTALSACNYYCASNYNYIAEDFVTSIKRNTCEDTCCNKIVVVGTLTTSDDDESYAGKLKTTVYGCCCVSVCGNNFGEYLGESCEYYSSNKKAYICGNNIIEVAGYETEDITGNKTTTISGCYIENVAVNKCETINKNYINCVNCNYTAVIGTSSADYSCINNKTTTYGNYINNVCNNYCQTISGYSIEKTTGNSCKVVSGCVYSKSGEMMTLSSCCLYTYAICSIVSCGASNMIYGASAARIQGGCAYYRTAKTCTAYTSAGSYGTICAYNFINCSTFICGDLANSGKIYGCLTGISTCATNIKRTAGTGKYYLLGTSCATTNCYEPTYYNSSVYVCNSTLYAVCLVGSSSRDLKENIKKSELNAIEKINEIDIVDFTYKDDENKTEHTGFIAEDTDTFFSLDHKHVDYYNALGALLKAVQELSDKNKELESRIEKLENRAK